MLTVEDIAAAVLRWDLIGLDGPVPFSAAKKARREAVRRAHPDNGGSHEAQVALNLAWEDIVEFMGWRR